MKATCWMGPQKMEVREVPDPQILNKRDAIVKVTSTAICGSDLHLYNGFLPMMEPGDIMGHEFMGEVVDVGSGVNNLKVGDRVVVPFPIACGNCGACQAGAYSICETPTRTRISPRSCSDIHPRESSGIRTSPADSPVVRPSTLAFLTPTLGRSRC